MDGTNDTRLTTYALLCASLRLPVAVAGVAVIGVDLALPEIGAGPFGIALLVIGLGLYFRLGTPRTAPVAARPPVEGRWKVMNSPGTRVPSHGVHAWGQTYAVDLVFAPDPADGTSPASRPSGSRPDVFPGFGKAVLAMGDGTVVEVHDSTPDHCSRSGAAGLLLFLAQAALRECEGPTACSATGSRSTSTAVATRWWRTYDRAPRGCGSATTSRRSSDRRVRQHRELDRAARACTAHGHPSARVRGRAAHEADRRARSRRGRPVTGQWPTTRSVIRAGRSAAFSGGPEGSMARSQAVRKIREVHSGIRHRMTVHGIPR